MSRTDYLNEASHLMATVRSEAKSAVETDEILTEPATASWIKISLSGLRKLRNSSRGPRFIRVGGSRLIRYRKSDVEAWLSRHVNES